jgi:dTDP-4-amino-4,6-dideoxygalactose transaminase
MNSKNIPLFKVFMDKDVSLALNNILQSGYIGQGPKVDEFEQKLSTFFGNPYLNTVNSGTSGLHLALHLIKQDDKKNRDEVITTPLTCTATNFPIVANGLKIKWADLDPNTCNVDLTDVRRKIGPKTLAIMVVHWGGYPCDLDELEDIKQEAWELYGNKIHVIEDCAHAIGSKFKEKTIGNGPNFSVFSFQAIKHLTTGDGGLLISPNDHFHRKAKLLRWYGLDRTSSADFRCEQNIDDWGFKFHMNDIAATIGIENLKHLEDIVKKHHDNHNWLRNKLQNVCGLKTMIDSSDCYSSSWIMTLLVDRRDDFIRKMKECGIGVSRVHDRNDKHACLKEFKSPLPTTDYVCDHTCCIPCGWWLSDEDKDYIVDKISQGW